jgi:hypothetical protein
MARNQRRLLTQIASWVLLLIAVSALALIFAIGSKPSRTTAASADESPSAAQTLQDAALNDLQVLHAQLTFRPFLPPSLTLPPGHLYDRVVWAPNPPVTGFGIFISSALNPSAGHNAIHMDESLMTPDELSNPRNPMIAFASVLTPVTLANGVWYEMQQQHDPNQGEWILIAQRGTIGIGVDGLDSKEVLENFAGSLAVG